VSTTVPMGGQICVCYGERMARAKYQGLLAFSISCVLDGAPPWFIARVLHQHQADLGYEPMACRIRCQLGPVDSRSSIACWHAGAEWRSG
jgi:hypothetical protein